MVLKWIYGFYFVKNDVILQLVKEISDEITSLQVPVNLSWVKAHAGEDGNEIADGLSKLGMLNFLQVLGWTEPINPKVTDWNYISYEALKGQTRSWERNIKIKKWDDYKLKNAQKPGARCRGLIDWDIGYSPDYKQERKMLDIETNRAFFKLRSGHCSLNGQRPGYLGNYNTICECCDYEDEETIEHFMFYCEAWDDLRDIMWDGLQELDYQEHILDEEDLMLRELLFPLYNDLERARNLENKEEEMDLIEKRLKVMRIVGDYIKGTGRLERDNVVVRD